MKRLANWLIKTFYPTELMEDILGDMEEQYDNNCEYSLLKANWLYFLDTMSLIGSYTIQKRKHDASHHAYSTTQNTIPMLKNYFKVALRSLRKQKLFTGINILGLSAGMSIGILFITMIAFVQTYDNFHENKDNIYRVITNTDDKVDEEQWASTPAPLARLLKDEHTGFGEIVRINKSLRAEAQFGPKKLPFSGLFVDNNFLDVFSFEMLEGDKSLQDPYGILLTQSYAKKLFSEQEPIGEIVNLGDMGEFTVRGILKDVPQNSHMWFEALLPYQTLERLSNEGKMILNLNEWKDFRGNYTYLMLPETKNIETLNRTLNSIAEEQYKNIDQFDASFKLQQLDKIAMGSDTTNELGTSWGTEIYLISISITLLILLPACFNYANISTARALNRAKEIGMRKVVGGLKKQIFLQFILETVIVSLISLVGAYFIFSLIRSEFQSMLVSGNTSMNFEITPLNFFYSILFAIFTGILAGIFPAIHFAGIKPITALKKTAKSQVLGKINAQKSLLVIQFALSFGFIMGIVVFFDQYRNAINYDLGFSEENILDVDLQNVDAEMARTSLDQLAAVHQVSMSSNILGVNSNDKIWIPYKDDSVQATQMFVDHNYVDNIGLELIAGKNLERSLSGLEQFVVINEVFAKRRGFENPKAAVGEPILINDSTELRVAGIVKDFHFQNLSNKIEPLLLRNDPTKFNYANVKIISDDVVGTITDIENEWKKLSPLKLEAKFFSDEIDEAFDIYTNVVKIFFFLGFLAITISCLGLLGMVVFSTQNRTKEVGIRKVMGAPVTNITYLLTKDFLKLLLIGSAISIPISYMLFTVMISQQNAYSTGIGVMPVIISLIILLFLGLTTVISQTWRTATANPTDTLRYE